MGSRREEERNEKIIRGLMKLPPNRRCINCNILGPQYVCTSFWTFVCMTCSGIHREFTHRVKSVSMSKFASHEVESLQAGGNQRAREIYLKHWDIQRQKLPDNSKPEKVREFIQSVYVDKKYTIGTISSPDNDTRRASSYHSYSQSPPYDFQYEDRVYGKLARKPGSDRGISLGKTSSFVSSPTRFIEDKFANENASWISDYSVSSGGDLARSNASSPISQDHQPFRTNPNPALVNHQEPSVDLFKLPGAPSSPFAAEKSTNLNQVSEHSGWANFDLVQPTKIVKESNQPVDILQPTKPNEDHHHQHVNVSGLNSFEAFPAEPVVDQHHHHPFDFLRTTKPIEDHALALNNFEPFQPTEPVIDRRHRPIDLFQPSKPLQDHLHQPVNVLAFNRFDPFQPTEAVIDHHHQPVDLFGPTKPIEDHHHKPLNVVSLNSFEPFQPTEPVISNHHQPIDLFIAAKPIEDLQHQPVRALAINNFDLFYQSEPRKDHDNFPIDHYQPIEPTANNVLVSQIMPPYQPAEPIKDYHSQPNDTFKAKDVLPLSGFGSVQPTELVHELGLNNTVSFDDLFSRGPVYMVEKVNQKSTNPFDDSFDTEVTSQMAGYIGSVSEPWFGSEVDANLGLVQVTQLQMGNLSLEGPVVSIGGNPFA